MSNYDPDVVEANRLYWETDDSVASIADRLDVSRRALYGAVHPLTTGATCRSCGGELAFENRSARKLGVAICPGCGGSDQLLDPSNSAAAADAGAPPLTVVRGDGQPDRLLDLRDPDLRHRAVMLGGAAIAGVALGTVAAIIATRRD
jgi:hypothetical protein